MNIKKIKERYPDMPASRFEAIPGHLCECCHGPIQRKYSPEGRPFTDNDQKKAKSCNKDECKKHVRIMSAKNGKMRKKHEVYNVMPGAFQWLLNLKRSKSRKFTRVLFLGKPV